MRSWPGVLLLVCGLGAGFVVGEHLAGNEAGVTRLTRWLVAMAPTAAPPGRMSGGATASPAPEPTQSAEERAAPAPIEIVAGGEATIIEDSPGAFSAEPIPLYRYFDGSGAIRMVEGLATVPLQYRHSAVEVERNGGQINQVEIPPPSRTAFRDWAPEFNPNRDGVILFCAAGCSACGRARQHLERLGVPYEIRDIHSDSAAKRYVRRILGRVVVPLLKVGGRHVSGYLPSEYDRLGRRS